MAYFYYWAPKDTNYYYSDGHYLRLGAYEDQTYETDEAKTEGIYFYTSGKYTLKSTDEAHQEIGGSITRKIESGGYDYTNEGGNLAITATEGGIKIEAQEQIRVTSNMNLGDTETSIKIEGNDKDVYFKQAGYAKFVDVKKEKTVTGTTYKTNIGLVIKIYASINFAHYTSFGFSYKTMTVGAKLAEISGYIVSTSAVTVKTSLTVTGKFGITLIASQIIGLHEEYCVIKNEMRGLGRHTTEFAGNDNAIARAVTRAIGSNTEAASLDTETVEVDV